MHTLGLPPASRLLGARASRLLYLTEGWVGQQALLLSPDEKVQSATAERLLRQHAAFEAAKAQGSKFWSSLVSRSLFQLVSTEQLVLLLKNASGQVDDKLKHVVKCRLSGIGQSKVSEDANNLGRSLESSARNKGQAPTRRLWMELVDKGLTSRLYSYAEPPWRNLLAPAGAGAKMPDSMFKPKLSKAPEWVTEIVSSKPKPSWFTSGPAGGNIVFADLRLMEVANEQHRWDVIEKGAQLSQVCRDAQVAIRQVGGGRWFMCLGDVVGEVVLGWPALAVCEGDKVLSVSFDPKGVPEMLLVYDHTQWDAVAYQCVSPWGLLARGAVRPREMRSQSAIVGWANAVPKNLLEVAAAHGFWGIPETGLGWYCRYLGLSVPKHVGLLGRLQAMISHLLPELSPQEVLELMLPRARMPAFYDEILMADDANDLIDEKDQEDFEKTKVAIATRGVGPEVEGVTPWRRGPALGISQRSSMGDSVSAKLGL